MKENKKTEHWTSFDEMGKDWGCKPVKKKTDDKNKLASQQEKFCARHICKACGTPMKWIGGNVMVCSNDKCNGLKHEIANDEGETKVWYSTIYDLLDKKGSEIAKNIFN